MNPKTAIETAEARRAERQKGAQQKTMKEAASQYQLDRRRLIYWTRGIVQGAASAQAIGLVEHFLAGI